MIITSFHLFQGSLLFLLTGNTERKLEKEAGWFPFILSLSLFLCTTTVNSVKIVRNEVQWKAVNR